MTVDVVTAGEAMGAVRAVGTLGITADVALSMAGSESNVAIGLARLGHAARWVGSVGDDAFGRLVRRTLAGEGVDVSHVTVRHDAPTGLLVSQLRPLGVATVDYHRSGSAGRQLNTEQLLAALDPTPRAVHVTGITPALGPAPAAAVLEGIRAARERGALVTFDVNFRSRLWAAESAREALSRLAVLADVVIGGEDEIALVAPSGETWADQARSLLDAGAREVVVKRGDRGAASVTADRVLEAPAHRVPLVDPIGAGDAFVAGYLSGWLDGLDVLARLHRGNVLGAFAVAAPGDWEALPSRADLGLLDLAPGDVLR